MNICSNPPLHPSCSNEVNQVTYAMKSVLVIGFFTGLAQVESSESVMINQVLGASAFPRANTSAKSDEHICYLGEIVVLWHNLDVDRSDQIRSNSMTGPHFCLSLDTRWSCRRVWTRRGSLARDYTVGHPAAVFIFRSTGPPHAFSRTL